MCRWMRLAWEMKSRYGWDVVETLALPRSNCRVQWLRYCWRGWGHNASIQACAVCSKGRSLGRRQGLGINDHLAAIVQTIIVVHNVRFLIIKTAVWRGNPADPHATAVDYGYGIRVPGIARWRSITQVGKHSFAVEITT